jgi:hypothetical protein
MKQIRKAQKTGAAGSQWQEGTDRTDSAGRHRSGRHRIQKAQTEKAQIEKAQTGWIWNRRRQKE